MKNEYDILDIHVFGSPEAVQAFWDGFREAMWKGNADELRTRIGFLDRSAFHAYKGDKRVMFMALHRITKDGDDGN